MKVSDVMTQEVEFIQPDETLLDCAKKMRDLDCGFLPIGRTSEGRLQGVITDRDLVIRGIAEGMNPSKATVEQIETKRVLYCFEGDDLESAADSMHDQQVSRLIVLNNPEEKRMQGVVSLGDLTIGPEQLAGHATHGIKERAH